MVPGEAEEAQERAAEGGPVVADAVGQRHPGTDYDAPNAHKSDVRTHMIKRLLSSMSGLLVVSCTATTTPEPDALADAFEAAEMPPAYMSAVNVETGESMTRAFGYEVSGDQIFRIASMTKTVTTVAALQLVERGVVELDEPLEPLVPALADVGILNSDCEQVEPEVPVTLRHLLSHSSGFGYAFTSERLKKCGVESVWDTTTPRVFEAGSDFLYGRGIGWAGLVVEELSGLDLESYFREHITGPLGLDRTWFDVPPALHDAIQEYGFYAPDDSADGYSEALVRFPDRVPQTSSNHYGGGSLFSSPNDYRRFLSMIVNGGELDGVRILDEGLVEQMFENQLPEGVTRNTQCLDPNYCVAENFAASNDLFGLGFALVANPDGSASSRAYWGGIFNSYFTVDLERKIVVVYFSQYLPYAHSDAYGLYRLFEDDAFDRL